MLLLKIKNLLSRIFTRPRATGEAFPDPATAQEENATIADESDPFYAYSEKMVGLDDIVASLGIHKHMNESNKLLLNMGKRDGAAGICIDVVNIARSTARSMFQRLFVLVKGRLGALDAQLQSEKSIMEAEEKLYQHEQAYYDYITYQYRFFPRNYSFLLAGIYMAVALLLIIADLPLALELIYKGFDFEGTGFSNLFKKGQFLNTLADNWETVLTALGISLSTVYIKIFYDEYVGTPYASRLMSFRKFLEENGFVHGDEQMEKKITAESNTKLGIKSILLLITIASIVMLAMFRNETNAKPDDHKFYAPMAFLAITILFPIIGGVCLSYSFNNLQNRMRLIRSKRICAKRLNLLKEKVKQYTLTKSNHEDLAAAAARLGDEQVMVEEYKDYLVAYYKRGYALGSMRPDNHVKDQDFFHRVEEWRNLLLSTAINQSLNKLN